MARRYSFPKSDRLFLQKEIDALFTEGNSFVAYPLRIIYTGQPPASGSHAAVLISVPKKKIKKAVNRNRIKRLIRETYRLNRQQFSEYIETQDKYLLIGFVYIGNENPAYKDMEKAMLKALALLTGKLR